MATRDKFVHIKDVYNNTAHIGIADIDDIESLEKRMDTAEQDIDKLQDDQITLTDNPTSSDTAKAQVGASGAAVANLEDKLQNEIDDLESELKSEIKTNVDDLQNQIDNLKEENEEEHESINETIKEIQTTITSGSVNNAETADKLTTARTIRTNLASTSAASFDGTSNITPGVTGTLPITNGGTGLTSSPSMLTNLASTSAANVLQASPRPGVTGVLPVANGGTGNSSGNISGNAETATKLATARTIRTNLASTSTASFDGTANITPGVTGTLAVTNGGTGLTSAPSMLTNLASTTAASVLQASPRPGITGTLPISHGGTGATTVSEALENLGLDSLDDEYVLIAGSRGNLAGYESAATSSSSTLTITTSSRDTTVWTTTGSRTLSFTAGSSSYCAVKVIACSASGSTTLKVSGASWANNEDAPDWGSSGALLVLVAHFIAGKVVLNVFHNSEA